MDILFYAPDGNPAPWLDALQTALPGARLRVWQDGDDAHADYAVLWKPPAAMLRTRKQLKVIFNLGAGVDAILSLGDALPAGVPIVRLDDAGMAVQMAEYVTHAALRYFRRLDEHEAATRLGQWRFRKPYEKSEFPVGVMGLGVLGSRVAAALTQFDFKVNGWSRSLKTLPGVQCYAGAEGLDAFLRATRLLVCVLPLTAETADILDRENLSKLQPGAFVINVARGAHVVEEDLLALVQSGHIHGAALDVFRQEPLPATHAFWSEPRISITPHMAAMTLRDDSVRQIAEKIRALEAGQSIVGIVDRSTGY
jgi:glyoxylate/hydroxypyruvate reductase A